LTDTDAKVWERERSAFVLLASDEYWQVLTRLG